MLLTLLKQPAKLILSKQPACFTVQSDDTGSPIRIKANIYGYTDSDSIAVDSEKSADFELSDYLQGLITERYKDADIPTVYSNVPRMTQVQFFEWVGSPLALVSGLTPDPYYLFDGYVPKSRRKALYSEYSSLLEYIVAKNNFIGWFPAGECKLVGSTQKEFVNYLQVHSSEPVIIYSKLILHFTDGGTATKTNAYASIAGVAFGKMIYFPVGFEQLGIQSLMDTTYPLKTLDYYDFQVSGILNAGMQQQSFKVDANYQANTRILLIRNPFGLLEIVRCTGVGEQNNELKIEISRTDGRILPDKISWKSERTDVVKANTGFMSKAQMQWFSDMDFLEAYELIGDVLHPIVFHDISLPVVHDDVFQYSAELEYEYAYNEPIEEGAIT